MIESVKPTINGELNNINQCELLLAWIDDVLVEFVANQAAKLDHLQQGITLASGTIAKRIGDRIKKEQQRIGRVISKVQKTLDYDELAIRSPVKDKLVQVDLLQDQAPIDFPDINAGTIPANNNQADNGDMPGVDPNDPTQPGACPTPPTRINQQTCEVEICSGDGLWRGTGLFNQKCIDDKNKPPDPPNDPPIPPQWTCSNYPHSATVYYGWGQLAWAKYADAQKTNESPSTSHVVFDVSQRQFVETATMFYKMNYFTNTPKWTGETGEVVTECGEPLISYVNIPSPRNSTFKTSMYTDEGENALRERYDSGGLLQKISTYDTHKMFVESYAYFPELKPIKNDLEYASKDLEQKGSV